MNRFAATPAERAAGALEPAKAAALLQAFERTGAVVLHDALPVKLLSTLAVQLDADAARLRLDPLRMAADRGQDHSLHHQLGLPRMSPWVSRNLVCNPILEQLAATLLGPGAFLAFFGGNTALPGSGRQGLHADAEWNWQTEAAATAAGQPWPHRPMQLVFQFGPREIREQDGATEIWMGTHADPRWASGEPIPATEAARLATGYQPTRLCIPAGAVALREMRMWHQGVENRSALPRHMLALIYTSRALHPDEGDHPERMTERLAHFNSRRLRFGSCCRSAFAAPSNWGISRHIEFVEGPCDHFGNTAGTNPAEWNEAEKHDAMAEHRSSAPRSCLLDHWSAAPPPTHDTVAELGEWVRLAAASSSTAAATVTAEARL